MSLKGGSHVTRVSPRASSPRHQRRCGRQKSPGKKRPGLFIYYGDRKMDLYQIEFTHLKTTPHRNIDASFYTAAARELKDDVAEPWVFIEKGYARRMEALDRARRLTKNGDYTALVTRYEPAEGAKFIQRTKSQEIADNMTSQYLVATKAYHLTGDISRETPDLCVVFAEDEEFYYGNWVTGLGFIGVAFPKETTREPSDKEKRRWQNRKLFVGDNQVGTINLV